jgi:hypothetical protein
MAAIANSTGAPACTTPTIWTQDPRALKLLASCAKNPPKGDYVHGGFALHREQDCSYRYTGYRAEALAAIRQEYGTRALHHAWATDDYAAHEAWCEQPTVTAAIDTAGLALVYTEAAIDLRAALMAVAVAPFQMAEAA